MQFDHHWADAALEAHLGDAPMLLRQISQVARLVEGDAHRFLDVQVQALFQAQDPVRVHHVRRADDVDRVGRHLLDHHFVVGVALLDAVLVARSMQPVEPEIADAGELHVRERAERWVVHQVRHVARADHGDADFGAGGECGHGNLLLADLCHEVEELLLGFFALGLVFDELCQRDEAVQGLYAMRETP
jgi:hypothetical protein